MSGSVNDFVMVAVSNISKSNLTESTQQNYFTLLNTTEIEVNKTTEKIVQLRDPHNKIKFTGRWSNNDLIWNGVSSSEKQRVGYMAERKDGVIFMSFDDFCQ